MADIWTAIERKYHPGANETGKSLAAACVKLNVRHDHELNDPTKVNGQQLIDAGATPAAVDLAVALALLRGGQYDHLMAP